MTVKPVGTVQHCSPCTPNPDMPSGVYFRLENTEGEMDPGLKEPKSSSAGTGLNLARTAVSLERGDTGDWKDYRLRHLDRRREFKQKEKYFDKYGNGCRHLFDSCNPGIPQTQDIQRREQTV